MRLCCITVLLAAIPVSLARADWAPSPEYIARQSLPFFKGKTPEQTARFLGHPNGGPATGAVLALAAHGEKVLPLLEKLMGDTNPWIRAGAIDSLAELYRYDGKGTREVTPAVTRAVDLASKLLDDGHPAVQEALGSFGDKIKVETPATRKIAVRMAASKDPAARSRALNMGRHWLKDPETVVRIGMLASAGPGNTGGDWNIAHMLVMRYSTEPVARQALPTLAAFLCHQANSRPYRGFFTDGAQYNAMVVMQDQWDREVEKMPDVVPGLCRCYVRAPHHNYKGWIKTRKLAWELLEKCSPDAVPAIRATIAEEKKWLAEVPDLLLQTTTEVDPKAAREKLPTFIAELEQLADKLQKKK